MGFGKGPVGGQQEERELGERAQQLARVPYEVFLLGRRQPGDGNGAFPNPGFFDAPLLQIAVQHQANERCNRQQQQQDQPGAETGEDKMLIISVGSGSGPSAGPSYENPDKSILSQIPGLISALMYAAEVDQDRRECEARPRSE